MDYITVTTGDQLFYIEKQRTAAILERPSVLRVPEAQKEILGLFRYDGAVLPLYCLGAGREYRCAVVVQPEIGDAFGIAAVSVGEEHMGGGELAPVLTCVWEKKYD